MPPRAIYELRTYVLKPNKVSDYIKLTNSKFHLRTTHSILNGFWFHELGGKLNAATHIWEYESLSNRAAVRAALATDENWINEYVSNLLPCLEAQENKVCVIPDWAKEISDFSNERAAAITTSCSFPKPNAYEIISLKKSQSSPKKILDILQEIIENSESPNGDGQKIVFQGCLETVIGGNDEYNILLKHENVDSTLREDFSKKFTQDEKSIVMLPAAWSPMK